MTLGVRSSSLHDPIQLPRRFAMVGALAASVVIIAIAIALAPSVKLGTSSGPAVVAPYDASFRADELAGATSQAVAPYDASFRADELAGATSQAVDGLTQAPALFRGD
jgi:hypothetical protein